MKDSRFSFDGMTRNVGRFNVRFRWIWIAVFIALSIAAAVAIPFTKVLYDISDYLPDDSMAAQGLSVLKEDFDDKGNAYAIIKGISEEQADAIATDLKGVKGVATTIFDPSSSYCEETSSALIAITFTDYDSTKGSFDTMERLIDATDRYDAAFIGQSANSYYTKLSTETSIFKVGIAIAAVILIMLLVSSETYFELIPMLLTLGISVLLNMGTNFLFFGISYISNLVSLILQLALSIDYSVILMHRFTEERENGLDPKEAAVEAQRKGVPEILSSSLTTFAGMCALVFMKLEIGVEIGLSLAKGVILSLFTVLFMMPALLVIFAKPLEKSRHKSFLPNVSKPTRYAVRARKIIVPVFLALIIAAGVMQSFNVYAFDMNKSEYLVAGREACEEAGFGKMNTLVLVVPNDGDYEKQRQVCDYVSGFEVVDSANSIATIEITPGIYLTDSFQKDELSQVLAELSDEEEASSGDLMNAFFDSIFDKYCAKKGLNPDVDKVSLLDLLLYIYEHPTYSALLPADYKAMLSNLSYAKSNFVGKNYVRMIFNINAGVEDKKAFQLIGSLEKGLKEYYNEFYMTGETVVCRDMAACFPTDNLRVNLITLAFILLILLFTFRNTLLPIILTITIESAIWMNCAIPFLAGTMVSFIGYLIICAIQMGATIDYAIVLTNRYYSIRNRYTDRLEAMGDAMNAVFPTLATSGIILTLTGFIMAFASTGVVAAMGSMLGFGALFAILSVLIVLPSFLLVTEKVNEKFSFKSIKEWLFKRKKSSE